MENQGKKTSLKIICVYIIRDILYILSFSYLGQGLVSGFYNFISNMGGSLLFMFPTLLLNLIITGIPLYFSVVKKWKYKSIVVVILPIIDFIINWNLFNLEDNVPYQLVRIALFAISLFVILKVNIRYSKFSNLR